MVIDDPDKPLRSARPTILLVDDEPLLLRMTKRMLRDSSWEVLEAHGSEAALALAGARAIDIDLLVTDVILPGLDGGQLAARLRERFPAMRVLFMSGYGIDILARYGVQASEESFLTKPFTQALFLERVRRALGEAPG